MSKRRVVITGLGIVSPVGIGVAENWASITAGRGGITRVTHFDATGYPSMIAGEVKGFDASHILDRKEVRRTDRYIQFALVCARQALDDAGLPGRLFDAGAFVW